MFLTVRSVPTGLHEHFGEPGEKPEAFHWMWPNSRKKNNIARCWYDAEEFLRVAFARLRAHRARFRGTQVSPKCLFGRGLRIERPWNVTIGARCVFQSDVWLNVGGESAQLTIGEYTFVGRGVEIEVSASVSIGKGCLIAPGVFITDHNHDTKAGRMMFQQPSIHAPVRIEDDVWIGANAVVLPGVSIGRGAVVGAGAVVNSNVADEMIVGGVPARAIRKRAG